MRAVDQRFKKGIESPMLVTFKFCGASRFEGVEMIDLLKVAAVVTAIIYLNTKAKSRVSTPNYRIMNAGLSLLLFASVLDFTDGIPALNHVPIIGQRAPYHDLLEDQFGDIPGFALFAFGALREIMSKEPVANLTGGNLLRGPRLALASLLNAK